MLHVVAECITSSAKPLHKRFRKGNTFKKPQMMHVAAAATDDEIILIFLAFAPSVSSVSLAHLISRCEANPAFVSVMDF